MEEWKEYKAIEFCKTVTDGTHDSPKPKDKGYYLITSKHLKDTGIDFKSANYISEEDYLKVIERSKVEQYDILFSMIGTIGNIVQVKVEDVDFAVKNMGIFKMGKNRLRSSWLLYWLKSPYAHKFVSQRLAGSTQAYLTLNSLREFPVFYPGDSKAKEIVAILKSLDDKIEVNRRINENLEQQAQALFKSWFVDFDPFKDGEFVESELGIIPKGWSIHNANDVFEINIGKTPPRKESQWFSESKKDNVWVSISDMGNCGVFISDSSEYLTKEAINRFNVLMVEKDTILLSFKLTIGRVAIADKRLTTNEAIARFILPFDSYREFLYLYLKQYQYASLGSTSSIATAVNSKTIKNMRLIMPSLDIIESFSSKTKPLFEQIRISLQESRRLAELRDSLLPRLMSGELKLNDVETII